MEFSYKVSEADYLNAWKLRVGSPRSATAKTVLFWVFILVCLLVLWVVVTHNVPNSSVAHQPATTQETAVDSPQSGPSLSKIAENIGPFVAILGLWIFLLKKRGPTALRDLYRKDPTMQGEFTVNITPESISTQNSVGTSFKSGWNIYASWRDGNDVIVLMPHASAYLLSGTIQVLSLAGLSDTQRSELRGILATALPKK